MMQQRRGFLKSIAALAALPLAALVKPAIALNKDKVDEKSEDKLVSFKNDDEMYPGFIVSYDKPNRNGDIYPKEVRVYGPQNKIRKAMENAYNKQQDYLAGNIWNIKENKNHDLKDIYMSPEAFEDINNWCHNDGIAMSHEAMTIPFAKKIPNRTIYGDPIEVPLYSLSSNEHA